MNIRKSVVNLTATEKQDYVDGCKALKANGRWDWFVRAHVAAAPQAHRHPTFLPWHRKFLRQLELEIQQAIAKPDFALPYWDWAADAALPDPKQAVIWQPDFMGGDGSPVSTGPFRRGQWETYPDGTTGGYLRRNMGRGVASLPDQRQVETVMLQTIYDSSPWRMSAHKSFRNWLEGWKPGRGPAMHNQVHVWVGGSMLPMQSPNDPVFFLHHCNVDRIWASWQALHPNSYLPQTGGPEGQNYNDPMPPWNSGTDDATPANQDHISDNGYLYEKVFLRSQRFPKAYLRMDGAGVTSPVGPGAGVVNCQAYQGSYEEFYLREVATGGIAFESVRFPGVFLRMDGTGVTEPVGPGAGVVNCQAYQGSYEVYKLLAQSDGTLAIQSNRFPKAHLRMDGSGVTEPVGPGGGVVNCQSYVGSYEKFYFGPIL